jgi:hypothetical protein
MKNSFNESSGSDIQSELTTVPGPLVKKTLLMRSQSEDFDQAKQEWEFIAHISKDSDEFVENCELCNHKNYRENWLIQNQYTQIPLKVGSDCIRRFIQFAGTASQADSNTFFDNKQKEMGSEIELLILYKEVIAAPLPTARKANRFKKTLQELLESRGQLFLLETNDGRKEVLKNLFKVRKPSHQEINNFQSLLNSPMTLPVMKETKRYKQVIYKEGSTLNSKRSKVTNNTLSNSESFKNPEKKYD